MDLDGDGHDDDFEAQLAIKLREVRADRLAALEDDSWTAVNGLHKLELELLRNLDEARRERERHGVAGGTATDEELVDVIVGVVPELTDELFAQLAVAVDARRKR